MLDEVSGLGSGLVEDAENVLLAEDQVLFAVDLHLAARVLAEQDAVAGLDVERELLALVGHLAAAHGDDLGLLGLLLGGIGDDDAAVLLVRLLEALDENAVVERPKLDLGGSCHDVCLLLTRAG